jgi:putative tricarboxylic transport membrane protein
VGSREAAMTTETTQTTEPTSKTQGLSELGVALLLLVFGVAVIVDATGLEAGLGRSGGISPKAIPFAVGGALIAIAVALAVDVLRGGRGEQESGEDIDLSLGTDWKTVALLAAAFVSNIVLIEPAGWPISGAVLFFGCAYALGSRRVVRDIALSVVLSIGSWYLFYVGLGIDLPAGVLEGIL